MGRVNRYVNLDELIVYLEASQDYAKLVGNHEKVMTLAEVKAWVDEMSCIEINVPIREDNTIKYRYTEERE